MKTFREFTNVEIDKMLDRNRKMLRRLGGKCPECGETLKYPNDEAWCPECHWMEGDDFNLETNNERLPG